VGVMERYYSAGGRTNPDFRYRVRVKDVTDEMYHWCSVYPSTCSFERYYVEWGSIAEKLYDVVQFETERPAILFQLKFGDQ
jgi:hypothetical protein